MVATSAGTLIRPQKGKMFNPSMMFRYIHNTSINILYDCGYCVQKDFTILYYFITIGLQRMNVNENIFD